MDASVWWYSYSVWAFVVYSYGMGLAGTSNWRISNSKAHAFFVVQEQVWSQPQGINMNTKKTSLIALLFCLFVVDLHAVKVVFRFDDPRLCADSISMRVVKLFNEKKVPLTIAMVPCDSSECAISPTSKDSLYIKELNSTNIEIALHGLTHQDISNHGEFGGLDSLESLRRIEKGKFTLQTYLQKEITTFIPPFNAYNRHTEYAMLQNGLSILSGDMYSNAHNNEIQYFPETLGHLMARNGIWSAAESVIVNCKEQDAVCVVMFHAYDLPDEHSWDILQDLLTKCDTSNNVELYTFQTLNNSGVTSTKYRYQSNQLSSGLQKYFLYKGVLHPTWKCIMIHACNALCYAIIPLLLLVVMCRKKYRKWHKMCAFVTIGSVSCLIFTIAYLHLLGPIKLLALTIGLFLFLLITLRLILHQQKF